MQSRKVKLFVLFLAISSAFFIGMNFSSPAEIAEACGGINRYFDGTKCVDIKGEGISADRVAKGGLVKDIKDISNTVVAVLLAFGLINIIYGGMQYTLAGVNEENAEKGKKRLLFTFLGIILLLSVYSVFNLVHSILVR